MTPRTESPTINPGNWLSRITAWRHKATHFSEAQARGLIEATPDREFADILVAGFLTGARYGELIACSVRDFDEMARTLSVDGKTGFRTIILQPEVVRFFQTAVASEARTNHC